MSVSTAIYWVRNDLRLADNPVLVAAAKNHRVVFVYIHSPEEEGLWPGGAASNWWLHYSLTEFSNALMEKLGGKLLIYKGPAPDALLRLAEETSASAVFFSKRYEPWGRKQEEAVRSKFRAADLQCHAFDSSLLFSPDDITTGGGTPYKVFTPFWRKLSEQTKAPPTPLRAPTSIDTIENLPAGVKIDELDLLPKIDWAGGIADAWQPGEAGARESFEAFLHNGIDDYTTGRDRPDKQLVSRISPHLHFGEISPRSIWYGVKHYSEAHGASISCDTYLKELGWREFAAYLLYHFPKTQDHPLREEFSRFPWISDDDGLQRWQRGQTGYPIVDAGMRELWTTGWMHNRVRMVVASFLVKDLIISWREGARWFWDTLVDADLANNTLGWQWSAGCGADAAPYFRIFNPVLQGEKFDPAGDYVRKWVPELARVPKKWIHHPWDAPALVLLEAGVELGKTYPLPAVDHALARKRALSALATISASARSD